jgi:antitoxin PrlF
MATATITSKGQITLPRKVRDDLRVGPGDRVEFVKMDDGRYAVTPQNHSVRALKGMLPPPPKPVTLEDMERAIRRGAGAE